MHGVRFKEDGPSPPPNYEALERQALEQVKRDAADPRYARFHEGFQFEEVRLAGEFPHTAIEVLFRWSRYPDLLLGHRGYIWGPDEQYDTHAVKDLLMFLVLNAQNRRSDLAPPPPDSSGVSWI